MGKGIKKYRKALFRGYPKKLERGREETRRRRRDSPKEILSRYRNHR